MKEKAAAESDEVITINFMAPFKRMCTSLKFTSKITAPHLHAEASGQERHSHWTQQKDIWNYTRNCILS